MWKDYAYTAPTNCIGNTFRKLTVAKYRAFHNVLHDYIYNKKTKGPSLMESFTAAGKLRKFFLTTRVVRCVYHG
jgi:hypothetical protein